MATKAKANAKAKAKSQVAKRPASDTEETPSKKVKVDDFIQSLGSGGGEAPSTPSTPNSKANHMKTMCSLRGHL